MNLPVEIVTGLLVPAAMDDLHSLSAELNDAYAKRQIFRTETEARVSVLDGLRHPTKASKYWQSVREQTVMLEQLALLSFDYRRNEVEIKRQTHRLATSNDPLDIESAKIDLDECLFKRVNMRAVAADRHREVVMWSKLKAELNDGAFNTQNVDAHQLISYTTQFALTAATVKPEQMTSGEFTNLAGQLQTALLRCAEQGVLGELQSALPESVVAQLKIAVA